MKYISKKVEIDAMQYLGTEENVLQIADWVEANKKGDWSKWFRWYGVGSRPLEIETLEGNHQVSMGDFIIRGLLGEYYPCKPEVFHKKYDIKVEDKNAQNRHRFFLDTEFHEYAKQPKVLGFKVGKPIPTIDLISIGIVAEDGRKYYAISKDFDVQAAWDNKWLRENVLRPVYQDLMGNISAGFKYQYEIPDFSVKGLKFLLNWYGKSREQIAQDICEFIYKPIFEKYRDKVFPTGILDFVFEEGNEKEKIEFWAYFGGFDYVILLWLFGRMKDYPKGFPMYCKDLKQSADNYGATKEIIQQICPQKNEHNALADAEWNFELYKALKRFKNQE